MLPDILNERVPRYVRTSLAETLFSGTKLFNDLLIGALGCYGGCWQRAHADPSKIAP